jgi:hypothetical protein
MKTGIIGVYDDHLKAVGALNILKSENFPLDHVSLIGRGESIKEVDGTHLWEDATIRGAEVGAFVGGALGILGGLGMLAVPGLGVVYVAATLSSTLISGLAGTTLGGLAGTVLGTIMGMDIGTEGEVTGTPYKKIDKKYREYLEQDKYLLVVHGPQKEVDAAHEILTKHEEHNAIGTHLINF